MASVTGGIDWALNGRCQEVTVPSLDVIYFSTNIIVLRPITQTSVSAIQFLDGVYNLEAVNVSHGKFLTFSDISEI